MASEAHTAEAAEGKVDIIGHLLDHDYFEVPFYNAHQYFDGKIQLPPFAPIDLFGVSIDLSITRHVMFMWLACLLLIVMLLSAFRKPKMVPSRLANFFEVIVVFIRDEVVIPIMGDHGKAYLPFLLTIFFFILFCNLIGLFPYSATPTGNINVTAGLALCTFAVMIGAGVANNGVWGFFKGLIPSGLPAWLLPLMILVELVSLFVKPFALCVRLFANMTGGHVAILVFLSLITILKSEWVAVASVPFAAAIYLLEIFIAFVQAFVFTLLSAVFISMSAHPDH
jgi:F-type H+-transporting ATPase subunit a